MKERTKELLQVGTSCFGGAMITQDDLDELATEDEVDESPYVEFDISVSPSDPNLELLATQLERGDIIIPFYQRKFVWKIEQASKLVESFLMGLPVPQVFLYVNAEDKLEVIDGQQRLMSVKYFMEGFFGEEDTRGNRQVFKLRGLSERSDYNGRGFKDLSERDQRRFRNATLRAINIKQLKPSVRNDSVFHIFERLNTGGTQLKPQEIRNAVYRGLIVDKLTQLNETPGWRAILGLARPDKNQKDIELILRLFSLYGRWQSYEKPMLKYLNDAMAEDRNFDSARAKQFVADFPLAVEKVTTSITKPFRPRGIINSAVLEAVMVTLLEHPGITSSELCKRYLDLVSDKVFLATTRGGTTDTQVLRQRLTTTARILAGA